MDKKPEEKPKEQVAISRRRILGESPVVVNEIADRCLYSGFFGTLDSARMKKIMDGILTIAERSENNFFIIDLYNLEVIDSAIAGHLLKLNKTLQLVGMEVLFCGIKPVVAQSIVSAGVDLENIAVYKNLKQALGEVYRRLGLKLVKIEDA